DHVEAQVGYPNPNDAALARGNIALADSSICHVHGRFGNSVHVHQLWPPVAVALKPPTEHGTFQSLTPKDDVTQVQSAPPRVIGGDQLTEGRRRLVEDSNLLAFKQPKKFLGGTADLERHHYQPTSIEECPPHFPDRKIEGIRMEQRPDVLFIE